MQLTSHSKIRSFWAALCSYCDFVKRYPYQNQTQQIEAQTQYVVEAWMATDDTSIRCIDGGPHKVGLQGMVNPLADAQEQQSQAQQQGVGIGDAFYLNGQADNNARCTKCHKEVVPVLHLKPGMEFVCHSASPVDQKSI